MNRLIFMLLAGVCSLAAQTRYLATTGDVSLTAAGTTLTIQAPAANAKQWTGETAVIYCSVACNVTQAKNGSAATATTGTWTPINPAETTPAATSVFTASNVGSGTTVGPLIHMGAGQTLTIDLSKVSIGSTGTATNYSIAVSSITGTANISVIGTEK